MVSFIKPSLLGSQSEYINRFVNPIQNGQHRDSNEEDVRLMKRRACVLHGLLTGFVDRKDYSLLKEYLPPKFEYIINIRLSDLQSKLYEIYLKELVDKEQRLSVLKKDFKSAKLFADYQYLQKIWTYEIFFFGISSSSFFFLDIHFYFIHILLIDGKNDLIKMKIV
jgi:transcriptional regulator ATRX